MKDGNNDAVRTSLDLSDDSSHDRPNSSGGSSTAQERPTISDIDLSESWSSSSDSEKNSSCRGKDPITCSNSSYDSETNAPDDSTDTTHGEASEDNSSDSGSGSSGSDATSESTPEDGTSHTIRASFRTSLDQSDSSGSKDPDPGSDNSNSTDTTKMLTHKRIKDLDDP